MLTKELQKGSGRALMGKHRLHVKNGGRYMYLFIWIVTLGLGGFVAGLWRALRAICGHRIACPWGAPH
jgi:hypothetical protein